MADFTISFPDRRSLIASGLAISLSAVTSRMARAENSHHREETLPRDVVMLPGLGSDAAVWQRTIAELGTHARCLVGDTLSDNSLVAMAARILANAPPRFALAGVSMGGMIALEIMRAAPKRVTGLALFDTNARPDTAAQAARRQATNAAMLAATDLAAFATPGINAMLHAGASEDVRADLMSMTLRVGAASYARQNRAVAARQDLRPVLASITVPTIVAVGAQDSMTPVAMAREISEHITGASLHIVPDCGHLPPIERPRETAALIRELLSRAP